MPNNPRAPGWRWSMVLLLAGSPAGAAPQQLSAVDQISRIETDTLVLKARERQLAVQAAIAVREQELAADRQGRRPSGQPFAQPQLLAIEGIGARLYATLLLEGGATLDVQRGDQLADGVRVVGIDARSVLLETAGKKRMRLIPSAAVQGQVPVYAGAAAQLPLPPARTLDK